MGLLHVVATPIGNLEDLSPRASRALEEADALACEDTRFTRRIFEKLGLRSPRTIFSYHEHNEDQAGKRILGLLDQGLTVALCSDGGYPGISDPGYRIVAECCAAGHALVVAPGSSAAELALVYSALPTSSFTFKGFPPRKAGPLRRFLEDDRAAPHTLIFYVSPYRLRDLLDAALEVLGDRRAAVCLELTKKFEAVHRDYLADLAARWREKPPRGEVTVVIAGNHPKFQRETAGDA